jgi:hypothetical protein
MAEAVDKRSIVFSLSRRILEGLALTVIHVTPGHGLEVGEQEKY